MLGNDMVRQKYIHEGETVYRAKFIIFDTNDRRDEDSTNLFEHIYNPFILNEDGGIDGYNEGKELVGDGAINNFVANMIIKNYNRSTHTMIGDTDTLYLQTKDINMLPILENISYTIREKVRAICNEINQNKIEQLAQIENKYEKISYTQMSESY